MLRTRSAGRQRSEAPVFSSEEEGETEREEELELSLREWDSEQRRDRAEAHAARLEREVSFLQSKVQTLLLQRDEEESEQHQQQAPSGRLSRGSPRLAASGVRSTGRATNTRVVVVSPSKASPGSRGAASGGRYSTREFEFLEAENRRLEMLLGRADAELAGTREQLAEQRASASQLKHKLATQAGQWEVRERKLRTELAKELRNQKERLAHETVAMSARHEQDLRQLEDMYGDGPRSVVPKSEIEIMQSHFYAQIAELKQRVRILRAALTEEERKNALLREQR
jgi:phage shock protein A